MSDSIHDEHDAWVESVQRALRPYLHQIPYGNLRTELSQWEGEDGVVSNLAVVYEVPGGSTNQFNITYYARTRTFSYLSLDAEHEHHTTSLDEVLATLQGIVTRIPDIRLHRLTEDVDRWASTGLGQADMFQKITKLLQIEDLRGGVITMQEMKAGIAYILAHYRASGNGGE